MFWARCSKTPTYNNPLPHETFPMKRLFKRCLSILCGTTLLSAGAMAAEPASCQAVRMGVVNWTDVIATSGMADVLLTGLGYDSKQTSAVQQIIFAGIRDKRLDIFLGYWLSLIHI